MGPIDPAARIGQVVDRYRLEAVLGTGGFGTVFRARHTVMDRLVALKLLHGSPTDEQRQRFVQEARAAAAIKHPSIIQVFDFGATAHGEMFLVMELLQGEDLEQRCRRQPLDPHEAIQAICEVLAGLSVAHAAGVVHRDLKPANVFLSDAGVKILDFGISLVRREGHERMTRTGLVMGTPLYMAPESFGGVSAVDERVDIYAVAAILYELLSGRGPFTAESYEQLIVMAATQPPTPFAHVAPGAPPGLADVIDKGLAPDPAQRWPDAAAFRAALLAFANAGISAPGPVPATVPSGGPGAGAPPGAAPPPVAAPQAAAPSAHAAAPSGAAPPAAVSSSAALSPAAPAATNRKALLVLGSAIVLLALSFGAAALLIRNGDGELAPSSEGTDPTRLSPAATYPPTASTEGTCALPHVLVPGAVVSGSTVGGERLTTPPCAHGGASERVYLFQLHQRMYVEILVEARFDPTLYIGTSCGATMRVVACNDDDDGSTTRSRIDQVLEAGTYYIVVDGFGDEVGSFELSATVEPVLSGAEVCAGAPTLTDGAVIRGSTRGNVNNFESSCIDGPSAPDQAYRIDVAEPSRLRLRQQCEEDGALHLRRVCGDITSEVACNDDFPDTDGSLITAHVEAGTYWAIVDGYDESDAGGYTLRMDLVADSAARQALDPCAAPQQLGSSAVPVDTLRSGDHLQGSCGGAGAPDNAFAFTIPVRSRVRAEVLESEFRGVYYIRSRCADSSSENFCGYFGDGAGVEDTQEGAGPSEVTLDAGSYFFIVDGMRDDTFGAANIHLIRSPE